MRRNEQNGARTGRAAWQTGATVLALLLAAGMAVEPAQAQEPSIGPSIEHTVRGGMSGADDRAAAGRQRISLEPAKQNLGHATVTSGPEPAGRVAELFSSTGQSSILPNVKHLSPVFGEDDGYVGLSWRF